MPGNGHVRFGGRLHGKGPYPHGYGTSPCSPPYDKFPGVIHQLCCQHLQRDLADAAETYPGAHWPVQIGEALQGLIHAANTARGQHLTAIPDDVAAPLFRAFRHGVILGLGQVKKTGGRKQAPCRDLLECLRDRQDDVLRFTADLRIPPTSNQAERDVRPAKTQQKISGRLRSGKPQGTGTRSVATSPPPPSTARTSSPPSVTPSPATPGCRRSLTLRNH